ncbi:MAG: hypothetical protein ACPGLV_15455 [Bacteroidia bacterium]
MNLVKTTLASFVLLTAIAFSYSHTKIESAEFGVCARMENNAIYLKLKNDATFTYKDQLMNTTGTWQQDGSKILLSPKDEIKNFRNVWKLEDDNRAIKSRAGLSFYRLVNKKLCVECEG